MLNTLPTDSAERKGYPLHSGCYAYFPAALAGVAKHSKAGNDKHNPGEPLHHARGKSMDHEDCIARHLMDLADLRKQIDNMWQSRSVECLEHAESVSGLILDEANALAWRALALSQELHEEFGGAPLAPAAREPGVHENPKESDTTEERVSDGEWIEHVVGYDTECPAGLHAAEVEVLLRNGVVRPPAPAEVCRWRSGLDADTDCDIVAYRVVE